MQSSDAHDRRDKSMGNILIGGPGRSGTTLLVQYFTALHFDTGFTLTEALAKPDPISRGGLEHPLGRTLEHGRELPYVAKSPFFDAKVGDFIREGRLRVRCCIIPIRSLADAAASRLRASERAAQAGLDFNDQPGGMQAGLTDPLRQKRRLAVRFYDLVHTLTVHGVDVLFLPFPDFAIEQGGAFSTPAWSES